MEQLKKAGKHWYALGTRITELKADDGSTKLCSWLNPVQQNIYDCGWVTVDDLRNWLNNTGRITVKQR
jgi:hypothetical protein